MITNVILSKEQFNELELKVIKENNMPFTYGNDTGYRGNDPKKTYLLSTESLRGQEVYKGICIDRNDTLTEQRIKTLKILLSPDSNLNQLKGKYEQPNKIVGMGEVTNTELKSHKELYK